MEQLANNRSNTLLRRSLKKTPNRSLPQNNDSVESADPNNPDLENTLQSQNDSNLEDLLSRKSNNLSRRSLRKTPQKTVQNESVSDEENLAMSQQDDGSGNDDDDLAELMTSRKSNLSRRSLRKSHTDATTRQVNSSAIESESLEGLVSSRKSTSLQRSLHKSHTDATSPQNNASANDLTASKNSNLLQRSLPNSLRNATTPQKNASANKTVELEDSMTRRKSNSFRESLHKSQAQAASQEHASSIKANRLEESTSRKSKSPQRSLRKSISNVTTPNVSANKANNLLQRSLHNSLRDISTTHENASVNAASNSEVLLPSRNSNLLQTSLHKSQNEATSQNSATENSSQDVENKTGDVSRRSNRRLSNQTLTEIETNSVEINRSARTKLQSFATLQIERIKISGKDHHVSFSAFEKVTEQQKKVVSKNISLPITVQTADTSSKRKSSSATIANEVSHLDEDPKEPEQHEIEVGSPVVDQATKESLRKFRKSASQNESSWSGAWANVSHQSVTTAEDEDRSLSMTKRNSEDVEVPTQSSSSKTPRQINDSQLESRRQSPRKVGSLHQTSTAQANVEDSEVPNQSSISNNKTSRQSRSFNKSNVIAGNISTNKTTGSKDQDSTAEKSTEQQSQSTLVGKSAESLVEKATAARGPSNRLASVYPPIDNSLAAVEITEVDSALETTDLEQQVIDLIKFFFFKCLALLSRASF